MSNIVLAGHLTDQHTQISTNTRNRLFPPPYQWLREAQAIAADLKALNQHLEQCSPQEILRWAVDTFGDGVVMSSSFQHHGTALLHMVSQVCPDLLILFIDTGFHFPETLAFKEQVTRLFSLRVVDVRPPLSTQELGAVFGPDLPHRNPDLCCHLNKVLPMQQALRGRRAWITGRRRDQSPTRAALPVVETCSDGLVKINPLAMWTGEDVLHYIAVHHLPPHPLYELGYRSIGCAPCTRPVRPGEHERAGRWPGHDKLECGLHTQGSASWG